MAIGKCLFSNEAELQLSLGKKELLLWLKWEKKNEKNV